MPRARRALLAGLALRLPGAAMFPALMLLCVSGLGTSYAAAGLASAAYTLTGAAIAPLRGRAIDRHGVRRVGLPLVPVGLIGWLAIGHVPYVGVVALAAVVSAASLPFWGISRQLVLSAVPSEQRTSALSLDSVGTELAYIVGPAAGIGLATLWNPAAAVTVTGLFITAGVVALVIVNPQFASEPSGHAVTDRRTPLRQAGVPAMLTLSVVVAVTLVGTDFLLLAKLRDAGHVAAYAPVAAVWAAGSVVGGLAYGARGVRGSAALLTGALGVLTLGIAVAPAPWLLGLASFVAGLGCAPVLTAITDDITRVVPDGQRTEALGWYSSAHTVGAALGSTGVGALIDAAGPTVATLLIGGAAVVVAASVSVTKRATVTTGTDLCGTRSGAAASRGFGVGDLPAASASGCSPARVEATHTEWAINVGLRPVGLAGWRRGARR